MKGTAASHRGFFLNLLMLANTLAYDRVIIEPANYKGKMYISANNFKLEDYRYDSRMKTEQSAAAPSLESIKSPPIDLDMMTFSMIDMNEPVEKSGKTKKKAKNPVTLQAFGFENTAGEYITGSTQEFITMEEATEKNAELQKWHPIYIKDDAEYRLQSISSPDMCMGVLSLEVTQDVGNDPIKMTGSNLKLMKCDSFDKLQRFKIVPIALARDKALVLGEGIDGAEEQGNSALNSKIEEQYDRIIKILWALSKLLVHIQQKIVGLPLTPLSLPQEGVFFPNKENTVFDPRGGANPSYGLARAVAPQKITGPPSSYSSTDPFLPRYNMQPSSAYLAPEKSDSHALYQQALRDALYHDPLDSSSRRLAEASRIGPIESLLNEKQLGSFPRNEVNMYPTRKKPNNPTV